MFHVEQFEAKRKGVGEAKLFHVEQFGLAAVGDEERCAVRFGEGNGWVEGEIWGEGGVRV